MSKVFYYSDPLNDDFAGTKIERKPLPENYEYLKRGKLRRGAAWALHHLVATPIAFLYLKISCGQKIVGRKKLRPYKKSGYFLYGNHTRLAGDAFTPSMISFPKKPYLLVDPDALSVPGCRRIVEDLGGMPVPTTLAQARRLHEAVSERMKRGEVVVIYPEAHIWPMYTGIRPFTDASFAYPVATGKPVFTFTVTYKKRLVGVKATVYIDGPFFPDPALPKREQKAKLRDAAYAAMCERSRLSTYEKNVYIACAAPEEEGEEAIEHA